MPAFTSIPPSGSAEASAVEHAYALYEKALAAHRQHNPPLTFAGFFATQYARNVHRQA